MEKSIKHFQDITVKVLQKAQIELFENPENFNEFAESIHKGLDTLACKFVQETLEEFDMLIKNSYKRKKSWNIEKYSFKQLITSFGTVKFRKTLYRNKNDNSMCYLLDQALNLDKHERITEDALVKIIKEATDSSFQKGGESFSNLDSVTRQTVKRAVHNLEFPKYHEQKHKKKIVRNLYIDADEDHIKLQFHNTKGDISRNEYGRKNNTRYVKLIYVYEGIEQENFKSIRRRLINPHYFCRACDEANNGALWDEVYEYICNNYEVDQIKNIYLNGDGGQWIKSFRNRVKGVTYIIDEFHLNKYIKQILTYAYDSKVEVNEKLIEIMKYGKKETFESLIDILRNNVTENKSTYLLDQSEAYITKNWTACRRRLLGGEDLIGCSAEGHVSHVLSSRMSSRPLGWSKIGAAKVARLREYKYNKKRIIDLVRFQKFQRNYLYKIPDIYSASDIKAYQNEYNDLGKYYDNFHVRLDLKKRKALAASNYCKMAI